MPGPVVVGLALDDRDAAPLALGRRARAPVRMRARARSRLSVRATRRAASRVRGATPRRQPRAPAACGGRAGHRARGDGPRVRADIRGVRPARSGGAPGRIGHRRRLITPGPRRACAPGKRRRTSVARRSLPGRHRAGGLLRPTGRPRSASPWPTTAGPERGKPWRRPSRLARGAQRDRVDVHRRRSRAAIATTPMPPRLGGGSRARRPPFTSGPRKRSPRRAA